MAEKQTNQFRDPTSLAKWTKISIYAQLAISCAALISGYLEYEVLTRIRDGLFESEDALVAAAEASDARTGLVGLVQFVILVASGILILRWIHRANFNARALQAQDMKFTPGWSIGWYFVPFANLWKPYQAMKEIWMASSRPTAWQAQAVPALIGLWWFLWIIYCMLGNASFRMLMRAKEVNELIGANVVTLLSDAAAIPLCLVFLALLTQVQSMQWTALGASNTGLPPTYDGSGVLRG